MEIHQVTAIYALWSVFDGVSSSGTSDLPGLFARSFCNDPQLESQAPAWCMCTNGTELTGDSLCRSYREIAECVLNQPGDESYLQSVYSRHRFVANLQYLCGVWKEIEGNLSCIQPPTTTQCDQPFREHLSRGGTLDQETACNITKTMSMCNWERLKPACPAKTRHYVAKLAQAYLTDDCTEYGRSVDARCAELVSQFHPAKETDTGECILHYHFVMSSIQN